jgi:hypothetical protein
VLIVVADILAACGAATGSGSSPLGTSSTSSPPAAPTPVATPAGLSAAYRYLWVGETRSIPGLTPPAVESIMKLDEREMQFRASEDWTAPLVTSVASVIGSNQVRLRLEADSAGCRAGVDGTYTFDLSPSGRALTVAAIDDPCVARVAAVSGAWTRSACPTDHLCLGDLDAGRHVSVIYTPFLRFADWHYSYGRFGYAVPEGWTNPEDNQDGYVLAPRRGPDGAGVFVFSDVLAHAQGIDPATGDCVPARAPAVGSSSSAIHDWIRSLPGVRIDHEEKGISIGGLSGFSVDLSVKPTWKGTCGSPDEKPGVPMFVNAQTTADEGFDWGISGDGRMRLFILSLGPDRTLLIDIEAQDKLTWDGLLGQAKPIVGSFEFRH